MAKDLMAEVESIWAEWEGHGIDASQARKRIGAVLQKWYASDPVLEPSEDQLWAMVRAYHGWKDDSEMVATVGYNLELYVARMREALKVLRPEAVATWQPMATAPKDGSKFLIVCATDENPVIEVCDWYEMEDWHWERLSEDTYRKVVTGKRGSWNSNGHRATHWMPLPALPAPQPQQQAFVCRCAGDEGLLCKTWCGDKQCQ